MEKSLFIGCEEALRIDGENYYKEVDDYMVKCSKEDFIEELKKLSWVCLTSWSGDLRQEYLDLVDYVKEIKENE